MSRVLIQQRYPIGSEVEVWDATRRSWTLATVMSFGTEPDKTGKARAVYVVQGRDHVGIFTGRYHEEKIRKATVQ